MEKDPLLQINNASVNVPVWSKNKSLRKDVIDQIVGGKLLFSENSSSLTALVLDQISLNIYKNDRVIIFGKNGSGKSSLLKLCCGAISPTTGFVNKPEKILSILGSGYGFLDELTGRENFIRLTRLLRPGSIPNRDTVSECQEWTELGEYFDLPIRTYSDGMRARINFFAMTNLKADLLVIDEVLSVGDSSFQEKASRRMQTQIEAVEALMLVTHSYEHLEVYGNRFLYMENGKMTETTLKEAKSRF